MGQFRAVIGEKVRPSKDEYLSSHASERHGQDLLLFLLLNWSIEKISQSRLQEVWGFFLHGLKRKTIKVEGFYKDIITGRYVALTQALTFLNWYGFMESRSNSPGYLFFCITPRDREALRVDMPQEFLDAIDEVGPIALRLYKDEVSLREGLSMLRSLRENTPNDIPA